MTFSSSVSDTSSFSSVTDPASYAGRDLTDQDKFLLLTSSPNHPRQYRFFVTAVFDAAFYICPPWFPKLYMYGPAFDSIPHQKLISVPKCSGINPALLRIICSYLTGIEHNRRWCLFRFCSVLKYFCQSNRKITLF